MKPAWTTLEPRVLHKLIKDNVRAMHVPMLTSLVDDGVFELEGFDVDAQVAPSGLNAQEHRNALWSSRLSQLCAFTRNATLAERHTTLLDGPAVAHKIPVLSTTDDFRAWFMGATLALADAWPRALAVMKSDGLDFPNKGRQELTLWMACACMLDLPDAAKVIHGLNPGALTQTLPLLGLFDKGGTALNVEAKSQYLKVSPVWVAWQFSANQCLDFFSQVSQTVEADAPIATITEKLTLRSVTLAESFRQTDFDWVCDNETYRRAIAVGLRSKTHSTAIEESGQWSLVMANEKGRRAHRVPAYLSAGVYQRQPTNTAASAAMAGLLPVLDIVVEDINPALLDTNTLYLALSAHRPGKDQRDVAVLQLLLKVKEKAGLDAARDLFWHTGPPDPTKSSPVVHLFDKNCDKVLVALMDAGIVEPHVARPGRNTPMEIAQGMNSAMVGVMASWLVRRSAHALLNDMTDDRQPKASP